MKIQFRLFMGLCALFTISAVHGQLAHVYNEVYAVDGVPGYTTYRIFAELENDDDVLLAMFAYMDGPQLFIGSSSNTIWNSTNGSTVGSELATSFCQFTPEICFDSFLTIGNIDAAYYDGVTIPCSSSVIQVAALPYGAVISDSFGIEVGNNLQLEDGAIFSIPDLECNDNAIGYGPNNTILLAQVTIPTGDQLEYNLNIQVYPGGDSDLAMSYIGDPAEGGVDFIDGSELGLHWPYGNCLDTEACNYNFNPEDPEIPSLCDYSCYGCTDSLACNYSEDATVDDGSCLLICVGCTSPTATNYSAQANSDDGSCLYAITGYAFFDGNLNAEMDTEGLDFPISGQNITLTPGDLSVTTDASGYFIFDNLPLGEYTLIAGDNEFFTVHTTPSSTTLISDDVLAQVQVDFGFANEGEFDGLQLSIQPSFWGYPCNEVPINHAIIIQNTGTSSLSGVIAFDIDPLFVDYIPVSPIDSVAGNVLYMSFTDVLPGQSSIQTVFLLTPDYNFMTEILTSTATVTTTSGISTSETIAMEVLCSWDPNDKYADPIGETEAHFITTDQNIDYTIRFQNIGNFPATEVLLIDTISDDLDLSSFSIVAHSHNMMVSMDPTTREVKFLFPQIELPDSTTNEPESHGYVTYIMKPVENTTAGTVIENTAHIVFDSNPAIQTSTVWHTIYECGQEADFSVNTDQLCIGGLLEGSSDYAFVDSLFWSLNGIPFSNESTWEYVMEEAGEHEISLIAQNVLCTSENSISILVNDIPEAIITAEGETLSATEGSAWQWYLDGEIIDGATNQSITITDMGTYSVEVTNDAGCSATSEGVTITSINDLATQMAVLFPNPMTSSSTLILGEGIYSVTITDAAGRIVRAYENINGGTHTLDRDGLASGVYQLQIASKDQPLVQTMQLIVQ